MVDVEGTVFMTQNCHNVLGTNHPQYVVKSAIEGSLEHNDLTHDVGISTDYFSIHDHCAHDNWEGSHEHFVMLDSGTQCAVHHFDEDFLPGHPDKASDFNHLLVLASDYVGNGWGGGDSSISPGAEYINDLSTNPPRIALGYEHAWLNVAMHEIGHCFSVNHGEGLVYKNQFTIDQCKITPLAPEYDTRTENKCGEATLDRDNYSDNYYDHYHWYDCSGATMRENQG